MTQNQQSGRGSVSRRGVLRRIGALSAASGVVAAGRAAGAEETGPYLTKLNEATFRGYAGGVSRTMGTETRRFILPDLEWTPVSVKSKRIQGVAPLLQRGYAPGKGWWYRPLSDYDTHIVTHENGERVDPMAATPARIEVPAVDEERYDAPVLGYRVVGTMEWGPAREGISPELAASEKLTPMDAPTAKEGPTPTRVEYELREKSFSIPVDTSWGYLPNTDQTNLTEQTSHVVLALVEPGKTYVFDIDCSRPPAWFDIELEVEVLLDEPRPEYGNEHGFANADEATFASERMTTIDDLGGYVLEADVEVAGAGPSTNLTAILMSAPNFYRSTIFREDNTGIAMGTEGLREDTYPHLYSWAVRPESGVTEWTIETTMYKQVQPGSGGYTHPYRRDPPFGIFDDNQ